MPLPLPSDDPADAEDDGVDPVAVALGVLEPLEHEERCAFPHHEAIGARVEWSGARGRQRADLAELHERGDTHVAVDATRDGDVELVVDEAFDGGAQGRQRRTRTRRRS